MRKKLYLLILFSITISYIYSQNQGVIPTKGKEFWVGFLNANTNSYTRMLQLFVSSSINTSGTVTMPLTGYTQSFTVTANVTTMISIPITTMHDENSEIVDNKSVLVQTVDTVSLFALNIKQYSSDATKVLPIQSLGVEYRVDSYFGLSGTSNFPSEFLIVATANNTQIDITPTVNTQGGHIAGVTFTINLNRGQTYQVRAMNASEDLTGTKVKATNASGSCRPFALFEGAPCSFIPINCVACDHIYEQAFPVLTWGQNFFAVPFSFASSYTLRIQADINGTIVTINGGAPISLNGGQFYEMNSVTIPVYITSNYRVSVTQYMEGTSCAGAGDPSMLILNSVEESINNITFSTITSTIITNHDINIIVKTTDVGQVTLDGVPFNPSLFTLFSANPLYSYIQSSISPGSHILSSINGFIGYVYGTGDAESYAYSVGSYSPEEITPGDTVFCTNDSVTLSAPSQIYNTWWSTYTNPDDTIATGLSISFAPTTNEIYILHGTSNISSCPFEYTFSVEIPNPPTLNITSITDTVCQYQEVQLTTSVIPASAVYEYVWSPASELDNASAANPIAHPSSSMWFYCTVSSPTGCAHVVDSIYIYTTNGTVTQFNAIASVTEYCQNGTSQLNVELEKILFQDNFNSGTNPLLWSNISLGTTNNLCGSVSGNALYFNGTGTRSATTVNMNTVSGGTISFSLKVANGVSPCDDADFGENIIMEYSINSGTTWNTISTYYEFNYPDFVNINITIPTGAQTASTRFRWRQISNSGNNQDNWMLDNIIISILSTSGFSFTWAPTTGLSNSAIPNPVCTTTQSATYYVTTIDNLTQCVYSDSVHINVGLPFTLTSTNDTQICSIAGMPISTTPSISGSYSYSWSPSSYLSNQNIANPIATPTSTTTFYVTATSDFGCVSTDNVTITVTSLNNFQVIPSDTSICKGSNGVQLNTIFERSCGTNNSVCSSTANAITGTETNSSSSSSVTPFYGSYQSSRRQLLYTQQELYATGMTQESTITKLAFNIASLYGTTYNNFSIKIGCTSLTNMPSTFVEGLHTVFNPQTVTLVSGWNYFNFNYSYDWDGVSNLLVEICYDNLTASSSSSVYYSYTSNNSVLYNYGYSSMCNNTSGYISYYRPNTIFTFCNTSITDTLTYSWSPASGLSATNIANPFAMPGASTMYYLTATDAGTGCVYSDSSLVNVAPSFLLFLTPDTTICSVQGIQLLANHSAGPGATYLWSPSTDLSASNIANPVASPISTTTYHVSVTSALGCTITDSVKITVNSLISYEVIPATESICLGESIQISTAINKLCGRNNSACSVSSNATIGTSVYSSSSGYITPFYGSYQSSRRQLLYTKQELNAMGMTQMSTLSKLAFNIYSVSGNAYSDFTIKIGCTSLTSLNSTFTNDLQTVFEPKPVNLSTGWNYFSFDYTYDWDGESNLLVEICYENPAYSSSSSVYYSTTSNSSVLYNYGTSVCNAITGYTDYYRPNTIFTYCNTPPINTLSFNWTPPSGLNNDTIQNPLATPVTNTNYIVYSYDNITGCAYSDSINITVAPNFNITVTNDTSLCTLQNVPLNVTHNGGAGAIYQWSPAGSLSATNIANPVASPTGSTTYHVSVTSAAGCTKTDSVKITVQPLINFEVIPSSDSICFGESIQISTIAEKNCGTNNSSCSVFSNVTIGTLSYTSSSVSTTPFYGSYKSSRRQLLYTQQELNAMGMSQMSTLTKMAFNLYSVSGTAYNNFTIKMGCTSLTTMPSTFVTGLQTVFDPKTINLTTGINNFVFDNSYDWDGVSNLLVEICYDNPAYSSNSTVYYSNTTNYSVLYYYGTSVCNILTGYTSYYRPTTTFSYCNTPQVNPIIYSWSPSAGLSATNISNPIATPDSITNYVVNAYDNISGCAYSDSVLITVAPNFNITVTNDTSLCTLQNVQLNVTHNGGAGTTFQWSPASNLSATNIANPVASPTGTTTYHVSVTSATGCTKTDSVKITVQPLINFQIIPSTDTICLGESIQILTISERNCGKNNSSCSVSSNATVGTSTYTSSSSYITPFYGSYQSSRRQFLYTKQELNAMGMTQMSTISKLGFNIYSVSGTTYNNFTIKIGCTSLTNMSSTFVTGLQTVFDPKTINLTTGINYFVFDNTYDWDGISNLLVEICYENPAYSSNSSVYYSTTSNYSVLYYYGTSVCNNITGYTDYYRPNTTFTYCNTPPVNPFVYTWSPSTDLSATNISNPVATPDSNINYIVNAYDNISGCTYSDSVSITVAPNFNITVTNDTSLCTLQNVQLNVTHNGGAGTTFQWSPASNLSATNIANPVASPTGTTTYHVSVTSATGCTKTDSVKITVQPLINFQIIPSTDTICLGESIQILTISERNCGRNNSSCSVSSNATVGTSTYTSSSSYITPFYGSYQSSRRQLLYTQQELSALGMSQMSTLTKMAFNLYSVSGATYNNFTIKMGCTSLTTMPSTFVTGLQTVFDPKTINLVTDWNYFVFDNSYDWDGVSNLLVEICYDNPVYSSNSTVYYSNTTNNSVLYNYGISVCNILSGYTSYYRPTTTFSYCNTPPINPFIYSWSPSTGLSATNISNPVAMPDSNTNYIVNAYDNISGCAYSDSISITVAPDFLTDATNDTSSCSTQGIQINVFQYSGTNASYQWSPSTGLSAINIANPVASPTATTTYYVSVTSADGCTKKDSVKITINSLSNFEVLPETDSICMGETVQITTIYEKLCGTNSSNCTSTANATIGTSSSTSSSSSTTPFNGSYQSSRRQILYTKQELNAAGLTQMSTITKLAFNIYSVFGSAYNNFTIKMGCTSLTSMPSTFVNNLQTVFIPKTINQAAGWNYFVLDYPYDWDGVSNLLVEICYDNPSAFSSSYVYYTSTGSTSVLYNYGAAMCNNNTGYTSYYRPNTIFTFCNTPVINPLTYLWSPSTGLDATNIANPIATPDNPTVYYLIANDPISGCIFSDSVRISVGNNFTIQLHDDTSICSVQGIQLTAINNSGPGATYHWSPATGVSSTNIANPTFSPISTTTYHVTVTSASGCSKNDSVRIIVNSLNSFMVLPQTDTICENGSISLNTYYTKTCGINYSSCSSTANATIGTSTYTSSSVSTTPFYSSYLSARRQLLYTKQELNAMGMTQMSTLTKLAFNISNLYGNTYNNFTIKVGCSSLTTMPTTFVNNLQTVFVPKTVNLLAGWNYFVFDNTYDWDGESNLLVEICYENLSTSTSSYVYYSNTTNNSVLYNYGTSVCSNITGYTSYYRPNTIFTFCNTPTVNPLTYSWYPSSGLSAANIANPVAMPDSTTTYYLTAVDSVSGCIYTDSTFINIAPGFNIFVTPDTTVCSIQGIQLEAIHNTGPGATYQWSPPFSLSATNIANPVASPSGTTTYHVSVTSAQGCTISDSVKITVGSLINFQVVPSADTICLGASIQISTINEKNCGRNNSNCSVSSNATIGNSTYSSSSGYITPFYGTYQSSRRQLLYTKQELNAMGMTQMSTLSKLAFNIYSVSGSTYNNFTIKIGCTSLTAMTSTFVTGLQTVFEPKTINLLTGWNYFVFDNTYDWDGVSNLLVEICYENPTYSSSSSVYYSSTSNSSVLYYYGTSVCNSITGYTEYNRPNTTFTYCNTPPVNTLTYSWSPSEGLNDANIQNPAATPVANTNYVVYALDSISGCAYTDSISVTVAPDFNIVVTNDTTLCTLQNVQLNVSHNGGAGTTILWSPAGSLSATNIANPIASPISTTIYYVSVTSAAGCTKTDSVKITIQPLINFQVIPSSGIVCQGDSIQISTIAEKNCGRNNSGCSVTSNATIGTSSYTSSSASTTPFYSSYLSSRRQLLYTKQELNAMGMTQMSTLSKLAFNIYSVSGITYNNFTIKIGCTSLTTMTSTFVTGLQTVFEPKTINLLTGWNYFIFDNTYDWDGVSNLLVEICYDNPTTTSSSSVFYSTTGNYSVLYNYGTAMCNNNSGYSGNYRPNTIFTFCNTPVLNSLIYSWTPSLGLNDTSVQNPLAAPDTNTNYFVIAVDSITGCTYSDNINITVAPNININVTNDTSLCNLQNVQLNVTHNGGVGSTFIWSPAGSLSATNIANPIASPLSTTTYYVSVTSATGCTKTDSVKIIVNPISSFNAFPSADTICLGANVLITTLYERSCGINSTICNTTSNVILETSYNSSYSSNATPYNGTYQSSRRQLLYTKQELNAMGMIQKSTINALAFNIYAIYGTNTYQNFTIKIGCTSLTTMTATFVSGLQTVFNPKTITIVPGWCNYTFDNTYDWDGISNLLVEICYDNPTASSGSSINYTSTVNYSVLYNYGISVCNNNTGYINNTRPNTQFTYCNTPPITTLSYLWIPSTGLNNAAITNPVATPQVTTTYQVIVTESATGCQSSDSVQINVSPLFYAVTNEDTSLCSTSGFSLFVTHNSLFPVTYSWTNGALLTNPAIQNPQIIADTTMEFIVNVTDINGCTASDTVEITDFPQTVFMNNPDTIICEGDTVQLMAYGGISYSWSPAAGLSNATIAEPMAYPVISTNYSLIAVDTFVCQYQFNINISVTEIPVATLGDDTVICQNYPLLLDAYSPIPGINYIWNNGSLSSSYPVTVSDTIWVELSNICGSDRDSIIVTVNPNPSVNIGSDTNICFNDTLTLYAGTMDSYMWNDYSTDSTLSVSQSGNYSVTVMQNGCSNSDTIQVIVQNPYINIGNDTSICSGNALLLNASGNGYSYLWQDGTTDSTYLVNSTGIYYVTIKSQEGCSYSDSISVNFGTMTQASYDVTNIICYGVSAGAIDATIISGTPPYSYTWSNGLQTEDLSDLLPDMYILTITDAGLCNTIDTIYITGPTDSILIDLFTNNISCNGDSNGSINTSISGGISPYTILWSTSDTVNNINNLNAGNYYITVTDTNNCSAFASAVISEPSLLELSLVNQSNSTCDNTCNGTAVVQASGGVFPYQYYWNNGFTNDTVSDLCPGINYVSVTDTNKCGVSLTIIISSPEHLFTDISAYDNVNCYGGADGNATVSVYGGTAPYNYTWSSVPVQHDSIATNLNPGVYIVTVSDYNSCLSFDTVTISQPLEFTIIHEIVPTSCIDGTDGYVRITVAQGERPVTFVWNTNPVQTDSLADNLSGGLYFVTMTDINNCSYVDSFFVSTNDITCLEIPSAFTPNGDNNNDLFDIKYIEFFPSCSMEIYNRWGQLMYISTGTYKPWDGKFQGTDVASGAYIYILNLNTGNEPIMGIITVIR